MVYDIAGIERRLNKGDWLLIGEVAAILGISRATVDRMLVAGSIRHRTRPGPGAYRECKPEDIQRLLEKRLQERGTGES